MLPFDSSVAEFAIIFAYLQINGKILWVSAILTSYFLRFISFYLFSVLFLSGEAFQPLKIFPLFLKNLKLMVISCQGEPYWENHGSIGLYRNHKITSPWGNPRHINIQGVRKPNSKKQPERSTNIGKRTQILVHFK